MLERPTKTVVLQERLQMNHRRREDLVAPLAAAAVLGPLQAPLYCSVCVINLEVG
jgi:hypothetical protein